MCTCVNWAKNVDRSAVGENFSIFYFLKSFRNWRKSSYFHFNITKILKFTHLEKKCAHVWIEPKMSTGPQWAKTSLFGFLKSLQNWRKSSYFHFNTSKLQKFTHLEENSAHVWIEPKLSTGLRWAKTKVFNFLKSFRKWRKEPYFHFRTSKI